MQTINDPLSHKVKLKQVLVYIYACTRQVQGTKIRAHFTKTNIEYIHIKTADRIQISNVFIVRNLTEYVYRIYLALANWPNTIYS